MGIRLNTFEFNGARPWRRLGGNSVQSRDEVADRETNKAPRQMLNLT
jgi:hypothetical protein